MRVGDYDIPEDWESMSCVYNCGYVLVWKRSPIAGTDAGSQMDLHMLINHKKPFPSFADWLRGFRKKG